MWGHINFLTSKTKLAQLFLIYLAVIIVLSYLALLSGIDKTEELTSPLAWSSCAEIWSQ